MSDTLNIPTSPIDDPAAWSAQELGADPSWAHELTAPELAELDAAVRGALTRGLETLKFDRADFPLPTLAPRLERMVHELEHGRGCVLIRGLDVAGRDEAWVKALYWGLGVHVGLPISQNAQGQLIGHVTDSGRDYMAKNVRGYTTRARLRPHCDPADTVGLLCWHPAKSGGESLMTSAVSIFNEILKTRPDLLVPLFNGFHFDLRGEGATDDPEETTFHRVPVFSYHEGRLSARFNQKTIEDGQKKRGEPLTDLEQEAVDLVGKLAMADGLRYDMTFRQGDVQILNNHSVMHSRNEFEDHPELERKRNLFRMWINLRSGRPLAPNFAERLNTGPRGGVMVRD